MTEEDVAGQEQGSESESGSSAGTQAAPPPPPPPQFDYPAPAPPPPAGYGYGASTAGAPSGWYVDPANGLVLPEGVYLAGIGRRIGAFFLGFLLFIVTLGIGWIIWGLIAWGRGQTPALQVLGMRCWRPDDRKVAGWGWMALRNIIGRLAEGILGAITQIISFVLFLATAKRQSLHDLIAGTVVLHDPSGLLGNKAPSAELPPPAAGIAPPPPPESAEQG